MRVPADLMYSCFSKIAQPLAGLRGSFGVEPPVSVPPFLENLKSFLSLPQQGASSANDAIKNLIAQLPTRESPKDSGPRRLRDLLPTGETSIPLAGIAALLGGGYLATKGVQSLAGMRTPGTFKNQLEHAILAQHNMSQARQLQDATSQLQTAQGSLSNRNLMLGGALALGAIPLFKHFQDN